MIVSFRPILWPWSHNSYKWISVAKFLIRYRELYIKTRTNKSRLTYIEEISIKKMQKGESYQILKIIIAIYGCKLLANSLAMITQFL